MPFKSNLQTTEPAFLSHEKYLRQRPRGYHKNLTYFCYSLSNLALIIACVLALIFSVKFLQDDPLYEYGEYLLTLKFYRYIVYIIIILPLTLLVPLFNAASACFLSGSQKRKLGSSTLGLKMFYQILMAILILIGLIFVAPSIRQSSVASQMEIEFRRHMKWRYDNEFSYEFLDRIQDEYECCDEMWYRSNFADKLPVSCYRNDGTYSHIYMKSCPEVLGSLVSTRCTVIAASLIAILLSLAILIGLDVNELMEPGSSRHYDIRESETTGAMRHQQQDETTSLTSATGRNSRDELNRSEEHDQLVEELSNRLKMRERGKEIPLLFKTTQSTSMAPSRGQNATTSHILNQKCPSLSDEEVDSIDNCDTVEPSRANQAILTRANYHLYNNRPKSPVFVTTPDNGDSEGILLNEAEASRPTCHGQPVQPNSGAVSPKSVLKKTSSFQRIDSDSDDHDDELGKRQVQRDAQTRRSLLNVRFAE